MTQIGDQRVHPVPGVGLLKGNYVVPPPPNQGYMIKDADGVEKLFRSDGSKTLLGGMANQSVRAALQQAAAFYIGSPDFTEFFNDLVSLGEGLGSGGFVGVTPTGVTIGLSGGGRIIMDMAGAGGIADYRQANPFSLSAPTNLIADATNDPWLIGWGGVISAVSPAGEIGLASLYTQCDVRATDGAGQAGVYVGVVGATSTAHYAIKSWTGTAQVVDTGINLDVSANGEHEVWLAHNGMGTLIMLLDRVPVFSTSISPFFSMPLTCGFNWFMRTTTAAHNTVTNNYFYAAGPRL